MSSRSPFVRTALRRRGREGFTTLRRRGREGFTMVELVVALLAGLIVAAGIVALSREATNTFHEEERTSAAEAAMRAAIDRLRADLQRAGFMSTGNILTDPSIAAAPGAVHVPAGAPATLRYLASIDYVPGGSLPNLNNASPALTDEQGEGGAGGLNPDLIQIGGNMTTADQYDVAYISSSSQSYSGGKITTASGGSSVTNCVTIYLSPTSPAMYRLTGNGDAGAAELEAAFQPDPAQSAIFLVRLVDDSGRAQYLPTCSAGGIPAAGMTANQPYVNVDVSQTPLQTAQSTGTVGALSGYAAGRAWVNPVQIVQWEITTSSSTTDPEPPQYVSGLAASSDGGSDPTKYDLMRSYVDAVKGTIIPTTSEIVAEYAVDLGFAFSVDTGTSLVPNIVTYAFGDSNNGVVGAQISNVTATPERIRAVRARLAIRAALPDRSADIPIAPGNYGQETYIYRYCVSAACPSPPAGALAWARVRTVTTEVALPNQANNFY